jgi:hypothetical protein
MHGLSHGGVKLRAGAGFPNPVGGGGWVPGTGAPRVSQEGRDWACWLLRPSRKVAVEGTSWLVYSLLGH